MKSKNYLKIITIVFLYFDAELLLCAFEKWGVEITEKLNGIFAIVILDHKQEKLYIFRDRVGIRPLYYYWRDGLFFFASELKSLFAHPGFKHNIDVNVLRLFFCYGYVPLLTASLKAHSKLNPGRFDISFYSKKILKDSSGKLKTSITVQNSISA